MPQVTLDLADRDINAACKEYLKYLIPKIWDTLTPETAVKLCNIIISNPVDDFEPVICKREDLPDRLKKHGFSAEPHECQNYDEEKPLVYLDYYNDLSKDKPADYTGENENGEFSLKLISMTRKEAKRRAGKIALRVLQDEIAYFDCLQEMIMEVLGHTPESLLACIIAEFPSIIERK